MAEAAANRNLAAVRLNLQTDINATLPAVRKSLLAAAGQLQLIAARDCTNGASFNEAKAGVRLLLAYERAEQAWPGSSTALGTELAFLKSQLTAYFICLLSNPAAFDVIFENDLFEVLDRLFIRDAKTRAQLPPGFDAVRAAAAGYLLRSLEARLPEAGLNNRTGAITDRPLLLGQDRLTNAAGLSNLFFRQKMIQLSDDQNPALPYTSNPAVPAAPVIDQAIHHLTYARRHRLILDARANLASFPSALGIAADGVTVPPDHPIITKARAHAREARRIAISGRTCCDPDRRCRPLP